MEFKYFKFEFQKIVSLYKTNDMFIEISRDTSISKINEVLKKINPGKLFNAKKHCGKVKWDVDGVIYQKKLRDEWK